MRKIAYLSVVTLLFVSQALMANTISMGKIKFKKGESSTTVSKGLARGEQHQYSLGAKAGQNMVVSISSSEENAVFDIYRNTPNGKEMLFDNAGDAAEEAQYWQGILPGKGAQTYFIVVGSTRGGADYSLTVEIE